MDVELGDGCAAERILFGRCCKDQVVLSNDSLANTEKGPPVPRAVVLRMPSFPKG